MLQSLFNRNRFTTASRLYNRITMKSRGVAILLCVVFAALANSSPTGKTKLETSNDEVERKIDAAISKAKDEDDLLSRAKKSPTTTTLCVEIKPGTDPSVVICDPSRPDQKPLIPGLIPANPEPLSPLIPTIPGIQPNPNQPSVPIEPWIVIPQPSQVIQPFPQLPQIIPQLPQLPQIFPQYPPQPQIIFVRDPNCSSNGLPPLPGYVPPPNILYPSPVSPRSAQNVMYAGGNPISAYDARENMMRSYSGSGFSEGESLNGFPNPLDLIYPRTGAVHPGQQNQQTRPGTRPPPGGNNMTPPNANPNSQRTFESPLLIQCNPMIIPLSPEAYEAATAAAGGSQQPGLYRTVMGSMGRGAMDPAQVMYQPLVAGSQAMYMPGGATPLYQKQSAMSNAKQHQPDMYSAQSQQELWKMMPGWGRTVEESQSAIKNGQGMSSQHSQATINDQTYQELAAGDGRGLVNQELHKTGTGKPMEAGQDSASQFQHLKGSTTFGQGQSGFVNGDSQALKNKEQGFQKQMEFSQHHPQQQQQQQATSVLPQQAQGREMSHNQYLMEQMKSKMNQGNLIQPYMLPPSRSTGDKQTLHKA